jgi:hypothetical protein
MDERIYPIYTTPQDIFSLPWKQKDYREFRKHTRVSGVYMLVNRETREIEYIGQSVTIGNRLMPSIHHVYIRKKHDLYILEEPDTNMRHYLERRCIEILDPPCNHRNGFMPREALSSENLKANYDRVFK